MAADAAGGAMRRGPRLPWAGAALWLALALPWSRAALEGAMSLHMLVQLPLLALAGWWLAPWVPLRWRRALAPWNARGITGLILVSILALYWMLPLAMDAAIASGWVELGKFTSVPLLGGLVAALSWPRAGFIVRGVFMLEATATLYRAGWLFLVAREQVCANYLVSDQQQLGRLLLAAGGALTLVLAWKLMWGHIRVTPEVASGRP